MPNFEEKVIHQFIGDGVIKLIERSLGTASQDRFEEALALFMRHYDEHLLDTTILYPSVKQVLRHFHDKKKVILTNKKYRFAVALSDALQLTHCFDDILGAESTPYTKPDARLVGPLLERYQAHPDRTVVIGDGVNDILLARNAGVLSCAILSGLTSRETLLNLKPDDVCEYLSEITNLFC